MARGDTRLVLAGLILMFLSLNSGLQGGVLLAYVLRPGAWALFALLVYHFLPRQRPAGGSQAKRVTAQIALLAGVSQVSAAIVFGLLEGFGRSPYSFSPSGILTNVWMLGAELVGVEVTRAWLVSTVSRHRKPGYIIPVAFLYFVVTTPLRSAFSLHGRLAVVQWVGGSLIPAVAQNLACTYLAFVGGFGPPVLYRAIVLIFWWLSPILPNLSWGVSTLISTAVPVACVFLTQSELAFVLRRHISLRRDSKETPKSVAVALVCMLAVWFAVGIFPVYPKVIVTGSMSPVVNAGDLVLVRKGNRNIDVGDVIEFRTENAWILHRVIRVEGQEGSRYYVTKGDANNTEDPDLVGTEAIRGRMIAVIPKVGRLSLFLRSAFAR